MSDKIAILTGGGDCPGLNAVLRTVVLHAHNAYGWDVIGIENSFQGLYEKNFRKLTPEDVHMFMGRGGTALGSSTRSNPEYYPVRLDDGTEEIQDIFPAMRDNLKQLNVKGTVVVGGDGTMTIAQRFVAAGLPVVGVPKTIDNDLSATDYTIGFYTAVETVTEALDRLQTTAESHGRTMICEVMGRFSGWISLISGLAGAADVILIPEIPYDVDRIVARIKQRRSHGISHNIIVIAEGAYAQGTSEQWIKKGNNPHDGRLGGCGERLAQEISSRDDGEVRVTVLGHIQRGGSPVSFDRILSARYGMAAVDLIANNDFGKSPVIQGSELTAVPISEMRLRDKSVPSEGEMVRIARTLGVELGN